MRDHTFKREKNIRKAQAASRRQGRSTAGQNRRSGLLFQLPTFSSSRPGYGVPRARTKNTATGTERNKLEFHAFDPRYEPATRTQFIEAKEGEPALIRFRVISLADAVQCIVHEVVHATPFFLRFQGSTERPEVSPGREQESVPGTRVEKEELQPGPEAVASAVQAGTWEEATTRDREEEIMKEIKLGEPWEHYTGDADYQPIDYEPNKKVRESFGSGLPQLTYEERFIVEEMFSQTRFPGINKVMEEEARVIALDLEPEYVDGNKNYIVDIEHHKEVAKQYVTPLGPGKKDAEAYIAKYESEWRNSGVPEEQTEQCKVFIKLYKHNKNVYTDQNELIAMIKNEMDNRHNYEKILPDKSAALVEWYESVPEENREKALEYFEWVLIAEAMSREWNDLGLDEPEPETVKRHRKFLMMRSKQVLEKLAR